MPVTVELKYEIFSRTWPGRIKLIELVRRRREAGTLKKSCAMVMQKHKNKLRCPAFLDDFQQRFWHNTAS
jgi:hypothetical protein